MSTVFNRMAGDPPGPDPTSELYGHLVSDADAELARILAPSSPILVGGTYSNGSAQPHPISVDAIREACELSEEARRATEATDLYLRGAILVEAARSGMTANEVGAALVSALPPEQRDDAARLVARLLG